MSKQIVLNGRVATETESNAGDVVFFVPDHRSEPYLFDRSLPISAEIIKPDDNDGFHPPGTIIQIVQAEIVDGEDVLLGFICGSDEGVCALEDVRILKD